MPFYTTNDLDWLQSVNKRGLGINPANVTKQWGDILTHPDGKAWSIEIPDDFIPRLAEIVPQSEMDHYTFGPFTWEQMNAAGWFPKT